MLLLYLGMTLTFLPLNTSFSLISLMTSLPFNILSCEHCIHREKEGQKFTEITPILLTLVHLNF